MKRLSVLAAGVLVVLMVHAWGGFAVSVSPLVSCDPDCTGIDAGITVNPLNCSEIYYCIQETVVSGPDACPNGGSWDETLQNCGPATECTPICGPGGNCQLTCNETGIFIGDAFDCSIYYSCEPIGPIQLSCNPDQYFNAETGRCDGTEATCCSGFCEVECDGTTNILPDPMDCRKAYICIGNVISDTSVDCPNDGYFDIQLGDCVTGDVPDPCPSLCPREGTASSRTTTTPGGGSGGSTDINGCVSSLVCTEDGDFAACSTCQRVYFHCSGAGASGEVRYCPDGYFFNPTTKRCVFENECTL